IRSGIDNLLQNAEGQEQIANGLLVIETATEKLAKLNQSLLLLARLENRHFLFTETLDLSEVIRKKVQEREETLLSKQLRLELSLENAFFIRFHPQLAEILVTNLLNNAIRHTSPGGSLHISLAGSVLSIRNTAYGEALDSHQIFQRFYKSNPSSEGTGLGLAIVREICVAAGLSIQYVFNDNEHVFTIAFEQSPA
ncbi:MAG TPA: ATP-binding protein, partial [Sediminibacterium sp.]|nr:ATP-binding protein [Sediminibacterium sp.]